MNTKVTETYPLSSGQQALWLLYQIAPQSVAYNIFITAKINSPLNISAFITVWNKIVERHPILRTTYTSHEGKPLQQINETQELSIELIDASHWSEDYLKEKIFAETDRLFNLETDSVLRINLFTCSEKEHILLLTMHHIAGDMWSFDLLLKEFQALYTAQIEQADSVKGSLIQNKSYTEFVRWQSEMLSDEREEKHWQYWEKQLAGELPILNLLPDKPRPPRQTYQGKSLLFRLEEQLIEKLNNFAQTSGKTLYGILLTAFFVLLYRYTNQEDILIGSPMRGHRSGDFKAIIGYFVNLVPLRIFLEKNIKFTELLAQVSNTVKEAQKHKDYPFSRLTEKLAPERDPSRPSLCQVIFTWQSHRWCQPIENSLHSREQVLQMEPFLLGHQRGADFDLNLAVMEAQSVLQLCWQYNTDLFEASTITRIAGHFVTLLEGIVAHPEALISQLPILTATEQQQLIEWNNTQIDYPLDRCLHQLFEQQVEKTPQSVAVVFENQQLTYSQLNDRANQLAHYLRSLGVGADVPVGICLQRSREMLVGILGILKAGGAYVPLDPEYPVERLHLMLSDSQIRVLLTQQKFVETLYTTSLPTHPAHLVCLDTDWSEISQHSPTNPTCDVQPENLAYVIYTSGSTGQPKGVAMNHLPLVNLILWQVQNSTISPGGKTLQFAPISFDVSCQEMFSTWCSGGTLLLISEQLRREPKALLDLLQEQAFERVFLPFVGLQQLAEVAIDAQSTVCLREIITAGEQLQMTPAISQWLNRLSNCTLHNHYGPSESHVVTSYTLNQTGESWPLLPPIGRPIANSQIYILDQSLGPVPVGVPGELHIGGVSLARGYLNRPELTNEKFIANPFDNEPNSHLYKTGDLARYLPDGNIEYLGRIDNQVKIRGFRIELGEIEAILGQHPQVQAAAAIVREDTPGDKRLVAYITSQPSATPTSNELRQYLKAKLPDYMVPSAYVLLETLPLTPSGKIDRRALPEPSDRSSSDTIVLPRNPVEVTLTQIWSTILKLNLVGVKDNFFDLGGHSLLAPYLMAQLKEHFGKDIPLTTLFENPTIEQLAIVLQKDVDTKSDSPLVAIQSLGSHPPLFCVPGAGGYPFYLYNLARFLPSYQPLYSFQANYYKQKLASISYVKEIAAYYIQAMQKVQPQGPYFLAGHSFGGKIAYEMALQLLDRGEVVALLAILDTTAPAAIPRSYVEQLDKLDDASWMISFDYSMKAVYGKDLYLDAEQLRSLAPEAQVQYVLDSLKMADLLPPDAEPSYLSEVLEVYRAESMTVYVPELFYPVPISLFRSSDVFAVDESEISDPEMLEYTKFCREKALGWDAFSSRPVDVHFVPGDHVTILRLPHVQVLAERLNACIQQTHLTMKNGELTLFG